MSGHNPRKQYAGYLALQAEKAAKRIYAAIESQCRCIDCSGLYADYKDANDFLIKEKKQ